MKLDVDGLKESVASDQAFDASVNATLTNSVNKLNGFANTTYFVYAFMGMIVLTGMSLFVAWKYYYIRKDKFHTKILVLKQLII